jgi:two-component system sensor histidine kinase HydH
MKSDFKFTSLLSFARPAYIISIALVIALIMISSAFLELQQSKSELRTLMTRDAESLIDAVYISSVNAVISNNEIEEQVSQRLLSSARMIARLDSISQLTQQQLHYIAEENNLFRVNIFNSDGIKISGNYAHDSMNVKGKRGPGEFISPVLKGEKDEIVIGFKEARHEEGSRFAVAVKRRGINKGVIVVNVDADYMIAFRKKTGFEKMVKDIGGKKGIEYIVLQDEKGIIFSNKNLPGLSTFQNDAFLSEAYRDDSVHTRDFNADTIQVFEASKTFIADGIKLGIIRIGISTEQMQALEKRMIRRIFILAFILSIIAFIVISIIFISQNYKLLTEKYERIQTYTGNILANMADAVISTDKSGAITIFNKNAEELFGIEEDKAIGKNISGLFPHELKNVIDSLNAGKIINNKEIVFFTGERKIISTISTAFTSNSKKEIDAFTIVIKDITSEKRLEEETKQREKFAAMGELASGVAHEIRNPLNAISMIAQRYEREFKPAKNEDEYAELTGVLISETKRVNNIIRQFLQFAKPAKVSLSNVEASYFLEEIQSIARIMCSEKKIKFTAVCSEDFNLNIDSELFKQAIINLIANSTDAVDEGGEIKFEISKINSDAVFNITDNGAGITKENLNKIFNIYFTTKQSGNGLGLSIVRQIISQHNGTIEAESVPGKETKFTITLPLT